MGRIKQIAIEFEECLNYLTNRDLCEALRARVHTEMATKGIGLPDQAFERDCASLLKALDDYLEWEEQYGRNKQG